MGGFIYLLDTGVIRTGDKHVRSRSGRASGPNEMRMRDEIPNNRAGSAIWKQLTGTLFKTAGDNTLDNYFQSTHANWLSV